MMSLVIPVYRNVENLPGLLDALAELRSKLLDELEVVFVVDGSPDDCYELLQGFIAEHPEVWDEDIGE